MGKFADDIMKYRLKVEGLAEQGFRKVVLDLDTKVVNRTPVDTGRARGSWAPNVGAQPTWGDPGTLGADASIGAVTDFVQGLKVGDTAWLSSGLPYIRVLEYGLYPNPPKGGSGKTAGGYSTQAPAGMVRISAVEFAGILEKA